MPTKKVLITDYVWPSVEPEKKVLAKLGIDLIVAPDGNEDTLIAVSYTHLTLPTIYSV